MELRPIVYQIDHHASDYIIIDISQVYIHSPHWCYHAVYFCQVPSAYGDTTHSNLTMKV